MSEFEREVILGVDTHLDTHVGAVVDDLGRARGALVIPTTPAGSEQLLTWARSLGVLKRAGVEGTGTYGAALARAFTGAAVQVIEVNRPDRSRRRRFGKSDPTDAENAARAVLAGDATGAPKAKSFLVEALRAVTVARRSAVKARTQAGSGVWSSRRLTPHPRNPRPAIWLDSTRSARVYAGFSIRSRPRRSSP